MALGGECVCCGVAGEQTISVQRRVSRPAEYAVCHELLSRF